MPWIDSHLRPDHPLIQPVSKWPSGGTCHSGCHSSNPVIVLAYVGNEAEIPTLGVPHLSDLGEPKGWRERLQRSSFPILWLGSGFTCTIHSPRAALRPLSLLFPIRNVMMPVSSR